MLIVAIICFIFSLTALAFCVVNNQLFRTLPVSSQSTSSGGLSVLIPARNEAEGISETLSHILATPMDDFEVVVLDDHSTDRTIEIVQQMMESDSRVRLHRSDDLPEGWCGKQYACHQLAQHARFDQLLFLDADVRLNPHAIPTLLNAVQQNPVPLFSGIPRQLVQSPGERLLIPLIHYILLCYLPFWVMKRTTRPSASAGCGQMFFTDRASYEASGGHAAIRGSLHDGVMLPRQYRNCGLKTDIADASQIASVRMYEGFAETWRGLSKNATEGVANKKLILPVTLLMAGAHVVPFVLLPIAFAWGLSHWTIGLLSVSVFASLLTRLLVALRFDRCWEAIPLHPIAILLFLLIQWTALVRATLGLNSQWRGRSYSNSLPSAAGR